jgi:hypothetical protein
VAERSHLRSRSSPALGVLSGDQQMRAHARSAHGAGAALVAMSPREKEGIAAGPARDRSLLWFMRPELAATTILRSGVMPGFEAARAVVVANAFVSLNEAVEATPPTRTTPIPLGCIFKC